LESEKRASTSNTTEANEEMYHWKDHSKASKQTLSGAESSKPYHWAESMKKKEEANMLAKKAKLAAFSARTEANKEGLPAKTGPDDSHIDVSRNELPKKKKKRRSSDSRLDASSDEEDEPRQRGSTGSLGIVKAKMKPRRCHSFGDKDKIVEALEMEGKQKEAKGTSTSKKSAKTENQPALSGGLAVFVMETITLGTQTSASSKSVAEKAMLPSATRPKKTLGERSRSMSNLSSSASTNKFPSNSRRATVQRIPRRKHADSEEDAPAEL
jgi:hypothetical protein